MPAQISSSTPKGQIAGQQAFGPYGEEMVGIFNGQKLPDGYKPLTGYTGHLNEDMTGLIYMKGRYYSPLWHRFINSDQGVDPNSINQFAYVGGRPFMATDPSGMRLCITISTGSKYPYYENGAFVLDYTISYCYCDKLLT
jgi:RHS repeat-associated protein